MKESSDYLPIISHDDTRSSSETEGDYLTGKKNSARHRRTSCVQPVIAMVAVLALTAYTIIVASVTWNTTKQSRRHGTRFLKCKFGLLTEQCTGKS